MSTVLVTSAPPQPPVFTVAKSPRPLRQVAHVERHGWVVVAVCGFGFLICGRTVFAGLAGTLFVLALTLSLVATRTVRQSESMLWLGLASALGVALSVRASPWLVVLNTLCISTLVLCAALTARRGSLFNCTRSAASAAAVRLAGSWLHGLLVGREGMRWVRRRSESGRSRRPVVEGRRSLSVLRSVLLAVPVLTILVPLLRSGDAAFAGLLDSTVDGVGEVIGLFAVDTSGSGYLVIGGWIGLAIVAVSGARHRSLSAASSPKSQRGELVQLASANEVIGALWIVNSILCVFALSQAISAIGLANRLQSSALSYREIAKDGFFPLLLASAVVLGSLLIAHLMLGDRRWERRAILSCQVMVGLNLIVVAVASRRLWLGAEEWGLTMLRVWSQAAAVLLGVMLLTIGAWQARRGSRQPIVGVAMFTAAAILIVMNAIPIEQVIVNWNTGLPAPGLTTQNELGVARCVDYYDKWHGQNTDAMPAFAPILRKRLAAGTVDGHCRDVLLKCGATGPSNGKPSIGAAGLRWNYSRAHANKRQGEWCTN